MDEINSMNIELQAKLLKVVEEQKYMKLGGERYVDVDVESHFGCQCRPRGGHKEQFSAQRSVFQIRVVQFFVPPLREKKRGSVAADRTFYKVIITAG